VTVPPHPLGEVWPGGNSVPQSPIVSGVQTQTLVVQVLRVSPPAVEHAPQFVSVPHWLTMPHG
jgi:hypothetical protein